MSDPIIHVEPVDKGLVTARDPSLLQPGELSRCDNACYLPYSRSLHKAPSRTSVASGLGGTGVSGLGFCAFDFVKVEVLLNLTGNTGSTVGTASLAGTYVGAPVVSDNFPIGTTVLGINAGLNQVTFSTTSTATTIEKILFGAAPALITQANGTYKRAVASTGALTFVTIDTVTEGETFDTIHFGNYHVLVNGRNLNRVLKADGTTFAHGLQPVKAAPFLTFTSSGGSWDTDTGFYGYVTTEYDQVNDVESTWSGDKPANINVTSTTGRVTVEMPARVNVTATHWRTYRSTKMLATTQEQANNEATDLATFVMVGESEIKTDGTQNTIVDGGNATTSSGFFPTAVVSAGASANLSWLNPNNSLNAADAARAVLTPALGNVGNATLELGTLGISGITAPVSGITINVISSSKTLNGRLIIQPYVAELADAIQSKTVPLTTSNATFAMGSATDTWLKPGFSWTPALFANGKFTVRLKGTLFTSGDRVSIDAITVVISHGRARKTVETVVFPSIVVKPLGIETTVGKNGPPPVASFGTVFQDSLCLDDATDQSIMRFSSPSEFHYFPSVYYLNFEGPEEDRTMGFVALGNVMIAGLNTRVARVNYLPRDVDAEFERGRCFEFYEVNHGFASKRGYDIFTFGGTQMLAYAARSNLFMTEGYRTRPLTTDINFDALVEKDSLKYSLLKNNPDLHELQFYYVPLGSGTPTVPTKMIRLSYYPEHLKESPAGPILKVSGPCDVDARSLALGVLNTGARPLWTGSSAGAVSLENQGAVGTMTVETRPMYLGGIKRDWHLDGAHVRHTLYDFSAASPFNIDVTPLAEDIDADRVTGTTESKAVALYASDGSAFPKRPRTSAVAPNVAGRAIALRVLFNNATHRASLDYLAVFGKTLAEKLA